MQPTILLAEDNAVVRDALRDTLADEGWRVVACADGAAALRLLEGAGRFDALLFDDEMPGARGLELVRRARSLDSRRGTPVVLISASEVGVEARRAGADAFLRKPEGVGHVVGTLARLLAASAAGGS